MRASLSSKLGAPTRQAESGLAPSALGEPAAHLSQLLQIRAQLAAVGCPLLGDTLYSASSQPAGDPAMDLIQGHEPKLWAPKGAIGLQACRLCIHDPSCKCHLESTLTIETDILPWWRRPQTESASLSLSTGPLSTTPSVKT